MVSWGWVWEDEGGDDGIEDGFRCINWKDGEGFVMDVNWVDGIGIVVGVEGD